MMRITHALALFAAVSALTTVSANAQSPSLSDQITVKGGIFTPAKGPVKDVDKNWWIGGAEYAFGNPDAQAVNSLEVLYSSKSGTVTPSGSAGIESKYKVLSFALNHKIRRVAKDTVPLGNILFYGGGIGLDYVDVKIADPNTGGEGNISKKKTVGGANLFIGYDIAANFQIEAKYQFALGKVADRDVSGPQFLLGFKF
ncbi:MAG TPA: hypothetical protein VGM51_08610 [Armatimonadota bacterium]